MLQHDERVRLRAKNKDIGELVESMKNTLGITIHATNPRNTKIAKASNHCTLVT